MKNAAELRNLLTERDAEIVRLRRQVDWLEQQFRLMQAKQFGASSERTTSLAEQLTLFNEAEAEALPDTPEPMIENITYSRKKPKGKRESDYSGLPAERIVHELPEDERICPDCGSLMHACGHDVSRRELTYVPAQYKVTEHVQTVYSCRPCERTSDHVPMKKSEVPAGLIPGSGVATPSLLAHIMNSKYALSLPLYRQEQELARLGVVISRQNMANWVITAHERWFSGLFKLLHKHLLSNEILHADESTLRVLHENGKRTDQKSWLWLYCTSGDAKHPAVLFDYQPRRAGECAGEFLKGFAGKLHTDGYDAYHKLPPEITAVGCWAHLRRKFVDAIKSLPQEIRNKSPAQTGFNYCNKLFKLESEYTRDSLSFDERYLARLEESKPVADGFFAWAKKEQGINPAPKTLYGAALTYAVNQESWLMNVFLDGRLELSNNRAERAIRPLAVGRRNWLFCFTSRGAAASASLYSIVETAKANGLKPYEYLKFLMERLPHGTPPEDCLPWSEDAQDSCR